MESDKLPSYYVLSHPEEENLIDDLSQAAEGVVRNVGFGFMAGTAGGSVYHFLKGFLFSDSNSNSNSNSTSTSILRLRTRLGGGLSMARANAPLVGGRAVLFLTLVVAVGTPLGFLRRDRDRFTPIRPTTQFIAGSTAAAVMSAARGPRASLRSALLGGSLWALPHVLLAKLEIVMASNAIKRDAAT